MEGQGGGQQKHRTAVRSSWRTFSCATYKIVTYASDSGFSITVSWEPAMTDFTPRELALAAAIVFVLCSSFIDQQVLHDLLESLRAFW